MEIEIVLLGEVQEQLSALVITFMKMVVYGSKVDGVTNAM